MTNYWEKLSARIDKLTTRERAMALGAAIVVVYGLLDTLVVSPVLLKQRQAVAEVSRQQAELQTLDEQLKATALAQGADPDAAARARLKEMQARLQGLDRQVKEQSAQLIAPERMREVLEKFLANRPRLQLVELKTLPRVSVALPGESAQKPAAGKPPAGEAEPSAQIYKHGVELTVRGGYLDLLEYLRDVEGLPVQLYWDKLQLTVVEYPTATLRLTIYTVSLDKAWLLV